MVEIPFPALGLIPLGLSALLGVYLLYRDKVVGAGSPIQLTGQQILVADTLFSAADFIVLLLSWAAIPSDYDEGRVMLGTYSTIPLMVDWYVLPLGLFFDRLYLLRQSLKDNSGIHAYLAIRPVRTALVYAAKHQPDVYGLMGRDNRMAYTPVSVDDEVVEVVEEGRSGGYA